MVKGYILVQTEVGRSGVISRALRSVPGVVVCDDVTGPYDVIVQAECESMDALGQLVVQGIQSVPGITRTVTCPVVNL
ncbi:Lrp/AsnC ligand binding domain-containing protein [Luteococcus sanguinis]|uniref:Lrp/AsnC ligand binding domain-containing protein n=1 Tax=Luteococcus sanguinis TaxID=174038 RepID=A0ABW1WXZ0_9ACTN